jgi:hypothetical protein
VSGRCGCTVLDTCAAHAQQAYARKQATEQAASIQLAREGVGRPDETGDQTLVRARATIRQRIAELDGIRARYLAYQQDRVNERDHHGAWDVAINLSETECELAGLRFALDAM